MSTGGLDQTDAETLAQVTEQIGETINLYDSFEILVSLDPRITDRSGWTIGNAKIALKNHRKTVEHNVTIGWHYNKVDLEVEFCIGDDNWTDLGDLVLHLYFLAIDKVIWS